MPRHPAQPAERKLTKNGVKLVSITQEMGDGPMHVMMRQIMALFDEYQSKQNAKPVMRALKENARQGPTACESMAAPVEKLANLVADHLEGQLLDPERLETVLAAVLDRREEHAERRREPIAEMNKHAAESELRLKRLYDAIEAGVGDLDDPALNDSIDGLKAIRDPAKADADRAQAMLQNSGQKAVIPRMLRKFTSTARERIRLESSGYRRDHLRALAQRVEAAEGEVRIMGSKSRPRQALVAGSGVNSVPTQGLKWRSGWVWYRTLFTH
jgi:site-specific DNA recombinase